MSLRTGLGGGKLTGMSSTDIDSPGPPRRHIAVLAFPDVEPVDAVGPIDIFASAGSDWDGRASRAYATELLAPEAGPVKSFTGLSLVADRAFAEVDPGELDTLIVAGGPGVWAAVHDAALIDWLAAAQGRVRRLCSVCSGAFLLAAAGLLDGRRATTHWRWCGELARRHPAVTVEPDLIWVRDGDIYTSAGVTAGMDLALALVEEDLGRAAAMAVARAKVMFLKRPGGQSQYSMALRAQSAAEPPLQALQDWIRDNLGRPLTVPELAERMAMSPRNFARLFARRTGLTPARYVLEARLEEARRRLEDTGESVERIAHACGFGSAERMRRSFLRRLGVGPQDYRRRFRPSAIPASGTPLMEHRP